MEADNYIRNKLYCKKMAYHICSLALSDESFPESDKVGVFHVFLVVVFDFLLRSCCTTCLTNTFSTLPEDEMIN